MKKLPWGTRNKLSDDELYGREKEISNIKSLLYSTEYANAPEILFTGVRGVGKTVFLNKIKEQLNEEGYLSILIDFSTSQSYQREHLTVTGIMKHYYKEIIKQSNKKGINLLTTRLKKYFQTKNFEIKDITTANSIQIPLIASEDDEASLMDFVLNLPQKIYEENQDKIKGVIILIDEFQIIKELNDYLNSFLWILRGHIQNHNNVAYIITGSMGMEDQLIYDIASQEGAFGGRIITQQLTPFDENTTKKYLNEKAPYLEFTQESFERFYKCTSGIPYYVNTLANLLPTNETIKKEDIIDTFDNNISYMIKYLVNIWIKLSNKEKDIIITLIDKPLKRKEISKKLETQSGSLSIYFKKLTELNLITNNNGTYLIKEEMLKRWLELEYAKNECYPYR
ncbi:MAG: ATP-binding protein [Methanosphaera stadtmanae]|nr:ATP-binding protein [Methanosphaera stadtmanae]